MEEEVVEEAEVYPRIRWHSCRDWSSWLVPIREHLKAVSGIIPSLQARVDMDMRRHRRFHSRVPPRVN